MAGTARVPRSGRGIARDPARRRRGNILEKGQGTSSGSFKNPIGVSLAGPSKFEIRSRTPRKDRFADGNKEILEKDILGESRSPTQTTRRFFGKKTAFTTTLRIPRPAKKPPVAKKSPSEKKAEPRAVKKVMAKAIREIHVLAKDLAKNGHPLLAFLMKIPPITLILAVGKVIGEALASFVGPWAGGARQLALATHTNAKPGPKVSSKGAPVYLQDGYKKVGQHGAAERMVVTESEWKQGIRPKDPENTTVEIWLEDKPSDKFIAELKTGVRENGYTLELMDLSTETSISIERGRDGKARATTKDPKLARTATEEITLQAKAYSPELIPQQIQDLNKAGVNNIQLQSSMDIPREKMIEAAEATLKIDGQLDLRGPGGAHLVKVYRDPYDTSVKINGGKFTKITPSESKALAQLVRRALWSTVGRLEVGKGDLVISRNVVTGGGFKFATKFSFSEAREVFSEYLAFRTSWVLRIFEAADPRTPILVNFWRAAMEHAQTMSTYGKADYRGTYQNFVEEGRWQRKWKTIEEQLTETVLETGLKNHPMKFLKVLSAIHFYSQTRKSSLLGFIPFHGHAFADNAFELLRFFELLAAKKIPEKTIGRVYDQILNLMGDHGNVEMAGSPVGVLYKYIPKPDGNGELRTDKTAANELTRLLEMKKELQKLKGKYRITVLPEDPFHGRVREKRTKTPEWIIEELDAAGNTRRALTVEVTEINGNSFDYVHFADRIEEKVVQVTKHQFLKGVKDKSSLIIIRFPGARGKQSQSSAASLAKDALNRRFLMEGRPDSMKSVRVMLRFDRSKDNPVRILEFRNGKWVETRETGYFDAEWTAKARVAVGAR